MEQVILYSNGCPKCRVIKNKLESKKINFVETSCMDPLKEKGYRTLPVLEVDAEMMDFMSANTWINEKQGGLVS